MGSHFNPTKTYKRLARNFYWKGMKKIVMDLFMGVMYVNATNTNIVPN